MNKTPSLYPLHMVNRRCHAPPLCTANPLSTRLENHVVYRGVSWGGLLSIMIVKSQQETLSRPTWSSRQTNQYDSQGARAYIHSPIPYMANYSKKGTVVSSSSSSSCKTGGAENNSKAANEFPHMYRILLHLEPREPVPQIL